MTPCQFEQVFKAAAKRDLNTLSYNEAMNNLDHQLEWLAVTTREIKLLKEKECWVECEWSEASIKDQQIIPCTWVFFVKYNHTGEITKYKA